MLGRFSDYVIANGGTTVLTEVPEMFGAEPVSYTHLDVYKRQIEMHHRVFGEQIAVGIELEIVAGFVK